MVGGLGVAWRHLMNKAADDSGRIGIARSYRDAWGNMRTVPDQTVERLLRALESGLEAGPENLAAPSEIGGSSAFAEANNDWSSAKGCYFPPGMKEGQRLWGIAVQLYGIRSKHNWGVGDFGDLNRLIELAAEAGADFIALNPVHAGFAAGRDRFSPYSPASREFLEILYIDVTSMHGYAQSVDAGKLMISDALHAALQRLRDLDLVDYAAVFALKEIAFRAVFDTFDRISSSQRGHPWADEFGRFLAERGRALKCFATYRALSSRPGLGPDWRSWPAEFRDPNGSAVAAYAERESREIRYHSFLQWQADAQLARCAQTARAAGMKIGLGIDLAVGSSAASAEGWTEQGNIIPDFHIGAPPDAWNEHGQDWGLAAYNPSAIERGGFDLFRRVLRAAMRHAGMVRIDHILGLNRLFLVPKDDGPTCGAYLRYPLVELCAVLAAESAAARCLVVGEDLGTVPEGLRDFLAACGILTYRLLMFATDDHGRFLPPEDYPSLALATFSTHDLPTIRGYWEGRDLSLRAALNLYADEQQRRMAEAQRAADRERLADALKRDDPAAGTAGESLPLALYRYLARTPCRLLSVQMEDLTGEVEQPNLPGTTDEHPNWRRKLSRDLEVIFATSDAARILAEISGIRSGGG